MPKASSWEGETGGIVGFPGFGPSRRRKEGAVGRREKQSRHVRGQESAAQSAAQLGPEQPRRNREYRSSNWDYWRREILTAWRVGSSPVTVLPKAH